ncbi:MAG: HAMP domain-containing histidine kinase [Proteobacteria bacterium]|nr:MAG: HAMP domain-containing histidine kinase [Pseudomonadota bacterium]
MLAERQPIIRISIVKTFGIGIGCFYILRALFAWMIGKDNSFAVAQFALLGLLLIFAGFLAERRNQYEFMSFLSSLLALVVETNLAAYGYHSFVEYFFLMPVFITFVSLMSGMVYGTLMTALVTICALAIVRIPVDKEALFAPQGPEFTFTFLTYLIGSQAIIAILIVLIQERIAKSKRVLKEKQILRARSTRRVAMANAIGKTSHELNNPMAILDGALRLLELRAGDPSSHSSLISAMQDAGDRLHNVVESITTFAEGDKKEEIIAVSTKALLTTFHLHSLELLRRYGANLDIENLAQNRRIFCRPNQLLFVLNVLLENAVEASEKASKVVWLRTRYENKKVRFEIVDEGKGISEDLLDHIFSPFTTSKPIGETMGMNLSLCRVFLEEQNGAIGFRQLEHGTQFWFELPTEA